MYKRSYHNINFIRIWPEKPLFFEGWSWFKFNNLGLALGTNLKFYISLSKGLKLKVREFWGRIFRFAEVTGDPLPPSRIGLKSTAKHCVKRPNTEFLPDWIRENTDQKKLRIWTLFTRNVFVIRIWMNLI